MTPEHIHDALTLLPADLIAEADKKRSGRPKVIVWRRYIAMTACFALVLCSGLFCMRMFECIGGASKEMAAAPAEMAVVEAAEDNRSFVAAPATPETQAAAAEAPAAKEEIEAGDVQTDTANQSASTANDQALCIDHSHLPAEEPQTIADPITGWCGNTSAVLYIGSEAHAINGSDAIAVTNILINLDYDPEKLCRCMAEYTADTETDTGYEINLTEYFVRFQGGQAALTQEQVDALREIITALGE